MHSGNKQRPCHCTHCSGGSAETAGRCKRNVSLIGRQCDFALAWLFSSEDAKRSGKVDKSNEEQQELRNRADTLQ